MIRIMSLNSRVNVLSDTSIHRANATGAELIPFDIKMEPV